MKQSNPGDGNVTLQERLRAIVQHRADWFLTIENEAADTLDAREAEIARLREALDYYACNGLGKCPEPRLKNSECVRLDIGGCGTVAFAALSPQEDR